MAHQVPARREGRAALAGVYPGITLKVARARRDDARKQLADGIDPSAMRKEAKETKRLQALSTLEAVSRDWLSHRASGWTSGTQDTITASLENHVFPPLGSCPVKDIGARDIKRVVRAVDDQGAGETAGRVFQRLRSIFRYALSEELSEVDPTWPLKPSEILRPRTVNHRRALTEMDMPAFFRQFDTYQGDPSTKAALELLILTAVRPGELRGAENTRTWNLALKEHEAVLRALEARDPLAAQAAILTHLKASEDRWIAD